MKKMSIHLLLIIVLTLTFWIGSVTAAFAATAGEQTSGLSAQSGDAHVKGVVIGVPPSADGIGLWTLQVKRNSTAQVIVSEQTERDFSFVRQGIWIDVRGTVQADGSVLATAIKLKEHAENEIVVRLKENANAAEVAARYGMTPADALLTSGNIYLFTTAPSLDTKNLVKQVAKDSDVVWAEVNYYSDIPEAAPYDTWFWGEVQARPYDTWFWGGTDPNVYVNQAAFEQVNLDQSQFTGRGVVVAVLDTGIAAAHPIFADRLVPGADFVDDDGNPEENGDGLAWGHGTHISGIIVRIAPDAQIMPVRVLDADGRGSSFVIAYAIEWAVAQGADVINLSLGTVYESNVMEEVVKEAIKQGVSIMAAAGNQNTDAVQYPAAYKDVLAITALDANGAKADFANYGKWIDLAAPGVGIYSSMVAAEGIGYASWSGTSIATAFVSGAAALVHERFGDEDGKKLAKEVDKVLTKTAEKLNDSNPDYKNELGGLLNIGAALSK